MTENLFEALNEKRIVPYFQPIFDLEKKAIDQHEALARLIQKNSLVQNSITFLARAKAENLYPELTKSILKQGLAIFSGTNERFSINLDIDDFSNEETLEFIKGTIKGEDKKKVVFEIVESDNEADFEPTKRFIMMCQQEGYSVSIDDFGAGYLTFDHVKELPAEYLKVDGYLVKSVNDNDEIRQKLAEIVKFCQQYSIKAVAERVEDEAIYNTCKNLGFNYFQGCFLGIPSPKPLDASVFF